jgi:hypothetical protein
MYNNNNVEYFKHKILINSKSILMRYIFLLASLLFFCSQTFAQCSIAVNNDPVFCFGQSTTVYATTTGGSYPYDYSINGVSTDTSGLFFGVTAGNYTIASTDALGCTSSTVITITQPTDLSAIITSTSPACFGDTGVILAAGAGGTPFNPNAGFPVPSDYLYEWYNAGFTMIAFDSVLSGIGAGVYHLALEDLNGCRDTVSGYALSQPTALIAGASIIGNTIYASASGGGAAYQYSLNGGTYQSLPTFNGITAQGIYTITVKDNNNCLSASTVQQIASALSLTADYDSIYCFGDATELYAFVSGGASPYIYSIDNGVTAQTSDTFQNITAGTYTILVTDAASNQTTTIITVLQPSALVANIALVSQPKCYGDSNGVLLANATGGVVFPIGVPGIPYNYVYDWYFSGNGGGYPIYFNDSAVNIASAGTFTLVVEDLNGCRDSISNFVLTQPDSLQLTVNATPILCFGATSTISASAIGGTGNKNYSIDGGAYQTSGTFTGIPAGTHTVTVRDSNNCNTYTIITIDPSPTAVTITATAGVILCYGGTNNVTLTTSGGTGTIITSPSNLNIPGGTYTFTATDANGCIATTSIIINAIPPQIVYNLDFFPIPCFGASTRKERTVYQQVEEDQRK